MTKRKRTKGQTLIYKTVHRKIKIEKFEPHKTKVLVNSDDRERESVFTDNFRSHSIYIKD
jgi:hypothetical protein